MEQSQRRKIGLLIMVGAVIVANAGGAYFRVRLSSPAPLGIAVGVTAALVFAGMLALNMDENGKITEPSMRTAIAASLLAQYQALVAMAVFYAPEGPPPSATAQTLITSFTSVVGVVIAFYFGASAYVEARKIAARGAGDP